ncbi:uncharacterized protein LOC143019908 [Oratosquilla oratoria]|uniref:uncharacterized protein LOC143019908 n=1 Tax=Oratosquilla oratoria TaxID=337810 RepID=UPI003F76AD7A
MISVTCILLIVTFVGNSIQDERYEGPLLSTFRKVNNEYEQGSDGAYRFSYSLPQQERHEERNSDGTVTGSYAFVDDAGEEVSVKYVADEEGFRAESDALPQVPEDTDEVKKAREEFFKIYEETLKLLGSSESDEDSEDSDSSDESDDDDEESSEEESDEEEEENEEEEEKETRGHFRAPVQAFRRSRKNFARHPRPAFIVTFVGNSIQDERYEGPLLSTFREVNNEYEQGSDGAYRFSYSLPQQERHEERNSDGTVTGSYAFVDDAGEEVSVKYVADEDGFRAESDALPQVPEDTDEVKKAREEFFKIYEETLKLLGSSESDEDSEDSDSSDESDDDDEESSEEESDEEEEENEEEEEKETRGHFRAPVQAFRRSRKNFARHPRPAFVNWGRR